MQTLVYMVPYIVQFWDMFTLSCVIIPTSISGPELNYVTCKVCNRKGSYCRQCIDGYGLATFSDGITCADCSHRMNYNVIVHDVPLYENCPQK